MMRGMPPGMANLLKQKYAILQQQADAGTTAATAGAELDRARAGVIPAESVANIGATNASTDFTKEQTKYFGPTALANIDLTKAQTGLAGANTAFVRGAQTSEAMSRARLNSANALQPEQLGQLFDLGEIGRRAPTRGTGRGAVRRNSGGFTYGL